MFFWERGLLRVLARIPCERADRPLPEWSPRKLCHNVVPLVLCEEKSVGMSTLHELHQESRARHSSSAAIQLASKAPLQVDEVPSLRAAPKNRANHPTWFSLEGCRERRSAEERSFE